MTSTEERIMVLPSLRRLFGYKSATSRPQHRWRTRPQLETLEGRLVPATLHVGSSPGDFHHIQDAVLAANPGDAIRVDPGTYPEQVKIATNSHGVVLNNLDLEGADEESIITLPAPGSASSAMVEVTGAKNVTINGFTIEGPGGPPASIGYGIEIDGAGSAIITHDHITHIRDNPLSGTQNGVAILVGRQATGTTGSAIIDHDTIDDYQKGGIVVDNGGSHADIEHTTIKGAGPTALIAQNGIQISNDATAEISHNEISGNVYTPQTTEATGIVLFSTGAVTVDHNELSHNDVGIYVFQPAGKVELAHNQISDSTFEGIDLDGVSGALLCENHIANSGGDGIALFDHSTGNRLEQNHSDKNGQDGIFVETGSTGNTFIQNDLQHNGNFDAEDLTTGAGTHGTGNTWIRNHGKTSNPPGLLSEPECGDDD
jgi:nitrous oxidase accessory protein NosD